MTGGREVIRPNGAEDRVGPMLFAACAGVSTSSWSSWIYTKVPQSSCIGQIPLF